eukprot:283903_1
MAAQVGNEDVVSLLTSLPNVIVDIPTNEDAYPLAVAAQNGYLPIVKKLLAAGSNPFPSHAKHPPLFLAAQNGHAPIIDAILQSSVAKVVPRFVDKASG